MKPRYIAIDGTAGAGKSTLGELLALRLGYLYIDTGAMYRAVTWLALSQSADIQDSSALAYLTRHSEIVINRPTINDGRQYTVLVNGTDVTWDIRTAEVARSVPYVSGHPEVRALLIAQQRAMAQREGVVMVGRDIGTVVLPTADLKLFLDASPEERARRRYRELVEQRGRQHLAPPSVEEILRDIHRRDELDRTNMQPAGNAIIINTDRFSAIQLLEYVYSKLDHGQGSTSRRERVALGE